MADPVQTYPLNPVPVGPVDPNPETAFEGRGNSPAFPNNGVVFPGGVEAVASLTGNEQKVGPAPMQTDYGYALTSGDDMERQATAETPYDPARAEGGEGGGESTSYVQDQPGGAQGGGQTQSAPGTPVDPDQAGQQTGPETLEQPPAAGAGQAPADAAQGGTNVPVDPYAVPARDADPDMAAQNNPGTGSTTTADTGSGADPGAANTTPGS